MVPGRLKGSIDKKEVMGYISAKVEIKSHLDFRRVSNYEPHYRY